MGSYIPSTASQRKEMLEKIGLSSFDELYSAVPKEMLLKSLDIPTGKSELEVSQLMGEISSKNKVFSSIFRGAGAYNHYIPSIVKSVASKEEFLTAYTPYQAEISQGILQSIFEYQTMMCSITGMDVSNASVYDGASAAAEAVLMCRERKRNKTLVSAAANPMVIQTIKTYCEGAGMELEIIPHKDGKTDIEALSSMLNDNSANSNNVAAVYIEQPNFFGIIEEAESFAKITHDFSAKLVMGVNPIAATILKTPFECGADIAVGEGQPLGMPLSFGGPYLGFMTATSAMMRKLPGRIVGETVDKDGKRGYVLTLQAREQHIRREKASSNICSNQALCALTASVYLAAMSKSGVQEVAELCLSKAHYAAEEMSKIKGFSLKYTGEFFHEFVMTCPIDTGILMKKLEENDILGGYPLDDETILWCFTELNTKAQIDKLICILKGVS